MNREHILLHLQETQEALAQTIAKMRRDPEYDVGELVVAVQHAYHHLNTAWNGRDSTLDQSQELTDELFRRWSAYPADLPPLGSLL